MQLQQHTLFALLALAVAPLAAQKPARDLPASRPAAEQGADDRIRLAVLPFDNLSDARRHVANGGSARGKNRRFVDRIAESCRAKVEQRLVNLDPRRVWVMDRDRLERCLEEQEFSGTGLVDPKSAVRIGKILAVRYLVFGTIHKPVITDETVRVYGVRYRKRTAKLELDVKVFDVETARFLISRSYEDSNSIRTSNYRQQIGVDNELLIQPALKGALKKFRKDAAFGTQLVQRTGKTSSRPQKAVVLRVAPEISGCTVEVNGEFVGTTPCDVELRAGQRVQLSVRCQGYRPWVVRMVVRTALANKPIAPRLVREDPPLPPEEKGGNGKNE